MVGDIVIRDDQIAFHRLQQLARLGYVADIPGPDGCDDVLWLKSLSGGPPLMLFSYGRICITNPANGGDIDPEDTPEFDAFLRTLRKPTWRERSREAREKYIYAPGCLIVMVALAFALARAVAWLWHTVFP